MIIGGEMSKVPLNITVDKEILERFKIVCEINDLKVSTKINSLMRDWIDQNEK